jgi:hypothetical protein
MSEPVSDGNILDGNVLDGNVLAGALGEVFTFDITAAVGQCAHCLRTGPVAEARVYASAPGIVARCPGCGEVILRLVRASGRAWLDLRGLYCLQMSLPDGD